MGSVYDKISRRLDRTRQTNAAKKSAAASKLTFFFAQDKSKIRKCIAKTYTKSLTINYSNRTTLLGHIQSTIEGLFGLPGSRSH